MVARTLDATPSPEVFLSSVGVGLSTSLIYVGMVGSVFELPGSEALAVSPKAVFLATLCALYAVFTVFSDVVSRVNVRRFIYFGAALVAVAVALPLALAGLPVHPAASYALALLYGAGVTLFKFAGVDDVLLVDRSNALFVAAVGMLATGAGLALAAWLGPGACGALVLGVVAVDLAFFAFSGARVKRPDQLDSALSKTNLRLNVGTSLAYGMVGVVICFVATWGARAFGASSALAMLVAAMALAVAASGLAALAGRRSSLMIAPVYHATFFPAVALLLLLPLLWGCAAPLMCALLAVLLVRDLARILNRLVIASEVKSQPVYLYSRTSLPLVAGLLAGFALADLAFDVLGLSAYEAAVVLVLLLCAASTVAPYGVDPQSMPERAAGAAGGAAAQTGHWRLACEEVAERARLTPRELDVAILLSRGRTAEVIARNLGISTYTVKTHISGVYRKTGAASQQEFISVVEERFEQVRQRELKLKERL